MTKTAPTYVKWAIDLSRPIPDRIYMVSVDEDGTEDERSVEDEMRKVPHICAEPHFTNEMNQWRHETGALLEEAIAYVHETRDRVQSEHNAR